MKSPKVFAGGGGGGGNLAVLGLAAGARAGAAGFGGRLTGLLLEHGLTLGLTAHALGLRIRR